MKHVSSYFETVKKSVLRGSTSWEKQVTHESLATQSFLMNKEQVKLKDRRGERQKASVFFFFFFLNYGNDSLDEQHLLDKTSSHKLQTPKRMLAQQHMANCSSFVKNISGDLNGFINFVVPL